MQDINYKIIDKRITKDNNNRRVCLQYTKYEWFHMYYWLSYQLIWKKVKEKHASSIELY